MVTFVQLASNWPLVLFTTFQTPAREYTMDGSVELVHPPGFHLFHLFKFILKPSISLITAAMVG